MLTYILSKYIVRLWGNAAKILMNRIIIPLKQAIKLMFKIERLSLATSVASNNSIVFFPELYDIYLSFFAFYHFIHYALKY